MDTQKLPKSAVISDVQLRQHMVHTLVVVMRRTPKYSSKRVTHARVATLVWVLIP